MKNIALIIVIIIVIIASMLAVAAPALASGACVYNAQHGWHAVGAGANSDHWFATEAECLASLITPTPTQTSTGTPTNVPTGTSTNTPTNVPTETSIPTNTPTDLPTGIPTSTEVFTSTPTQEYTSTPTQESTATHEFTMTPTPTSTPEIVQIAELVIRHYTCSRAWSLIENNKYKDVGYRYFESHPWCQSWLMLKKGIDYDYYKLMHP